MYIIVDHDLALGDVKVFEEAGHSLLPATDEAFPKDSILLATASHAIAPSLRKRLSELRGLAILDGQAAPRDLEEFSSLGLPVLETGNSEARSQADFIIWKILEWARKRPGEGRELAGARLGFLGFGPLAEEVAKRAAAFGMELLASSEPEEASRARSFSCRNMPWVDLFVKSDVLFIGPDAGLQDLAPIGKDSIRLLPEEALLISLGNLDLFDFEGLLMSLDFDYLQHAVFDLPASEEERGRQIARFPQAQVSYQEAGHTAEARLANLQSLAEDVDRMERGEVPLLAVNRPKARDRRASLSPWAELAELLGELMGQRLERLPQAGDFQASGVGARLGQDLIEARLFQGLARGIREDRINLISARPWAKQQGMRLDYQEDREGKAAFKLNLKTGRGLLSLQAGIDDQGPFISEVDGYRLHARPQGTILLIPHPNKPGMVGLAGRLLGSRGVNINGMVLGHAPGFKDRAMMWILLSKAMEPELLDLLRQEAEMQKAEQIVYPFDNTDEKGDKHARH